VILLDSSDEVTETFCFLEQLDVPSVVSRHDVERLLPEVPEVNVLADRLQVVNQRGNVLKKVSIKLRSIRKLPKKSLR
jgi:hypothetical protein